MRRGVCETDREGGKGAAQGHLRATCRLERTTLVFVLPFGTKGGALPKTTEGAGRMRIVGRVLEAVFPS